MGSLRLLSLPLFIFSITGLCFSDDGVRERTANNLHRGENRIATRQFSPLEPTHVVRNPARLRQTDVGEDDLGVSEPSSSWLSGFQQHDHAHNQLRLIREQKYVLSGISRASGFPSLPEDRQAGKPGNDNQDGVNRHYLIDRVIPARRFLLGTAFVIVGAFVIYRSRRRYGLWLGSAFWIIGLFVLCGGWQ